MTAWRITLHARRFTATALASSTGLAELSDARSRRLELQLNAPAKLTLTVDGRSASALEVQELTTELMAWRDDVLVFRGPVMQSEDVVTAQAHAVNITAMDYLAVLNRRYLNGPADVTVTQLEQDSIVEGLRGLGAENARTSSGVVLAPGSVLPVSVRIVNPDGSTRTPSGVLRDRVWPASTPVGQAITDLGACLGGFDVDIRTDADASGGDFLRVFYPQQGTDRPDLVLAYGASVAGFTRSVVHTDYANYRRLLGAPLDDGTQLYSEAWNADVNDVTRIPVGLWAAADQEPDVSLQATLDQHVRGALERSGVLVPSYSLTLAPGWYTRGAPNLGDTVPLSLRTGRLDVDTTVRVLGIAYAIGDDGQEDVELTVGRPAADLTTVFRAVKRDVSALARR